MKKNIMFGLAILFALVAINVSFAGTAGKMDLKVGDEVYVCGCGEACPCQMMAMQEGKCTCGKDLVKAKVTKVEKEMAYVMVDGKEQGFKTTGKYACACGESCPCKAISQSPGKCPCGKEMIKVE